MLDVGTAFVGKAAKLLRWTYVLDWVDNYVNVTLMYYFQCDKYWYRLFLSNLFKCDAMFDRLNSDI